MPDGKYGFYESIDYTSTRLSKDKNHEVVKTYMAHHQGLSLLSINNCINNNILEKRFNKNPEIEAVNILLQEKMPIKMIITKEKKEKVSKNKLLADSGYIERVITSRNKINKNIHVISNENYKVTIDDFGNGVSEYNGKMINNYKVTSELKNGIFFYIKNTKTKKIIDLDNCEKVIFAPDKVRFIGRDANIKFEIVVTLDPDKAVEIRRIKIENLGVSEEVVEVICEFEPCLASKSSEYAHPAFSKLFLNFEEDDENIIVQRKSRNLQESLYVATTLYTESEQIVNFEYEIDKEKYQGRENYGIPNMIKNQKIFSKTIKQLTSPIVVMKRTIKVAPQKDGVVDLIITASESKEEAKSIIQKIKSEEEIDKILNIAKARCEEQNKYLQITGNKLEIYQQLLNYILQPGFVDNKNPEKIYSINSLWKYGISGNLPILLVEISKLEEVYVLEDIVRAFEYYRTKNINIDLIIINNEKNVYERFVEDSINSVISERQLQYLKNISSGIFILNKNDLPDEDLETIKFKSKIQIDCKNGDISSFIKENNKKVEITEIKREKNIQIEDEVFPLKEEKLLFDNGYGGFTNNGREYVIYKNIANTLPAVWSNVIANKFFGTVVTDNLGGYTWYKNSRLNRLTAWNNTTFDFPSEIYYFKDENNGMTWTLNSSVKPNKNYYYIRHGFGYSNFQNSTDNLIQNVDVFVPNEENVKVLYFKIKNIVDEKRIIKLLVYIKPVLGEDEYYSNGNIKLEKKENIIFARNVLADEDFKDKVMYVTSNEKIGSFTGDKNNFFGNGSVSFPDGLYKELDNNSGIGKESCIAFEIELSLDKFEDKKFVILIGEENNKEKINDTVKKFYNEYDVESKLENVKTTWNNLLNIVNVKTPSESINLLMNGWLVYQTIVSRIYARTGYYQSGRSIWF